MNKSLLCLISGILVAALLAGCTAPQEKSEQEWEWYENKEWGYKIKYPADWRVSTSDNEEKDRDIFVVFPGGSEPLRKDKPNPQLQFIVFTTFSNQSTYEMAKGYLENEKHNPILYHNFECKEFTNITLDGAPATKITVTFNSPYLLSVGGKDSEGILWIKQFQVYAKKGRMCYELLYTNDSPDADNPYGLYEEYLGIANQMTSSFRLI